MLEWWRWSFYREWCIRAVMRRCGMWSSSLLSVCPDQRRDRGGLQSWTNVTNNDQCNATLYHVTRESKGKCLLWNCKMELLFTVRGKAIIKHFQSLIQVVHGVDTYMLESLITWTPVIIISLTIIFSSFSCSVLNWIMTRKGLLLSLLLIICTVSVATGGVWRWIFGGEIYTERGLVIIILIK